jgi:TolB-like protein
MPDPWRKRIAERAAIGIGVLVLLLTFLLVWYYYHRRTEHVVIAVLPFESDKYSATTANIVTDSVAHRMASVPGFAILPGVRTADYRIVRDSAHAIARALGVRYLLVGRVEADPTASIPNRIVIDSRLIDTQDSPPTIGQIMVTTTADLCPTVAAIVHDIAAHFARAPVGHRWGPGGTSGCGAPSLLQEFEDPAA